MFLKVTTTLAAFCACNIALAEQVEFNIDPQSTDETLLDIAETGDVQIVFAPGTVEANQSPEVRGNRTVESALDTSLDSTNLVYEFKSDDFVVVKNEKATASRPAAASNTSPPPLVLLAQLQETADENDWETSSSNDSGANADAVDNIIVTGTRLRNASPTSPVTVITSLDIERQGITSVEGIIRSLPQNFASHTQTSAIDNSSSVGTLGVATANLRGLGSDGTLVLVNGRRTATTPTIQGSNINLNSIPFSAIDRVEVLTDGAAAIYGGDAVGGVINFILKKGYDAEEEIGIRYTSGANGGDTRVITPSFGTSWGSGSINGSIRFEESDPVVAAKAGFTTLDFTSRGGTDHRTSPFLPWHPLNINNSFFAPLGGVDPSRDATVPVTLADFSVANLVPFDYIQKHLSDERETISAHLSIDQNLTETLNAYVELTYSDYESYAERGGIFIRNAFVPTSNAFNNTGENLFVGYHMQTETENGLIEPSSNQSETSAYGVVLGVDAELPFKNWELNTFVKFAEEESSIRAFDGANPVELAARLADSDPATALNLFGDGSQQTQAAVANLFQVADDIFAGPTTDTNDTSQFSISGNGDLFEMPGGNVSGVLGYDYRRDSRTFSGYLATTLLLDDPEREVNALFTEIMLPIVGEGNNMAGIHSLQFRAAARWEEYAIKGPFSGPGGGEEERTFSETSPSFGVAWHVTEALKFRANVGETFKAPRMDQLFSYGPPQLGGFSFFIPSVLAGAGIANDPVSGLPIGAYPTASTGNPDLQPETSDTMTVGIDWSPQGALDGLIVSASYFEVETQGVVQWMSSVLFDAPEHFIEFAAGRDASGAIVQWNMLPVNFSEEKSRSADLDVRYDFDASWGELQLGFSGTYMYERSLTFVPGDSPIESQETMFGPDRIKYRAWFGWDDGPLAATLNMHHSSSYMFSNFATGNDEKVDSYTSFDLTGSYEMDGGWNFNGGVRNLTDTDFPFVDGRQPFDPRRVDIMGRTWYLEISKAFDLL